MAGEADNELVQHLVHAGMNYSRALEVARLLPTVQHNSAGAATSVEFGDGFSLTSAEVAALSARASLATEFIDPRSPAPVSLRLVPYSSTREPIAAPGESGAVYAVPASAVSGAAVTLHQQNMDETIVADTITMVGRCLPFTAPRGAAVTTAANVNIVVACGA